MLNLGFALLLQFSFNYLALPLLTSFRFSIPSLSLSFTLLQRLCFFGGLLTATLMSKFIESHQKNSPGKDSWASSTTSRQTCVQWLYHSYTWLCHSDGERHRLGMSSRLSFHSQTEPPIQNATWVSGCGHYILLTTRRQCSRRFFQERVNSKIYYNSFFPCTIREWNNLPRDFTAAASLEEFQASLMLDCPSLIHANQQDEQIVHSLACF